MAKYKALTGSAVKGLIRHLLRCLHCDCLPDQQKFDFIMRKFHHTNIVYVTASMKKSQSEWQRRSRTNDHVIPDVRLSAKSDV